MNDKTQKQTLVEEGTEFVGTMRATCPIVVRGKVEGDVEAPAVSVTGSGSMSGNVKAKRVDSQGVLAGSVEADEVSLAGEVRSDTVIRARSLEVKLAAEKGKLEVTFGECILDIGDAVTEHAAADDSATADAETFAATRRKKRPRPEAVADAPSDVAEATAPATAEAAAAAAPAE